MGRLTHFLRPLGDLVLGTDPRTRLAVRVGLLPIGVYAAWCLMHLYCVHLGLTSPAVARLLIAHHLVGMFAFYPLVRSGRTAKLQDFGLVLPQILYASSSAVLAYPMLPFLRPTILQMLGLVQVFGLFSLLPRQTMVAGLGAVAMLLSMLTLCALIEPAGFQLAEESIKVGLASFVLILLALATTRYSRIRGAVRAQKAELAQAVEQIRLIATRDPLTNLHNRQHMEEQLQLECGRQARSGRPFTIALIDLDHFKQVNDRHGHQVGDEVLCGFAEQAQPMLRTCDLIARWGGEEFLVLLPDTTADDAMVPLERLRRRVSALSLARAHPDLHVTLSAGAATHHPGNALDKTIDRADCALYASKAGGRNRVTMAPACGLALPPSSIPNPGGSTLGSLPHSTCDAYPGLV